MIFIIEGQTIDIDCDALFEKIVVTKRKYTDNHPQHSHSTHAPTRTKILELIKKNGGSIKEDDLLKNDISRSWLKNNIDIVVAKITKLGKVYMTTDKGNRILKKLHSDK